MELSRTHRSTLVIDAPDTFFPCLLDMPLKLAAKAVGVGGDRIRRAYVGLVGAERWPCSEIYHETHRSITKSMVVAARAGEIFRLRKWIAQNNTGVPREEVHNAEEVLRALERAERFAGNYAVVRLGRSDHVALAAEGVSARIREQRDYRALLQTMVEQAPEPVPVVERPFYEQYDLDRLFQEHGDELGLGPM